MSSNITSTGLSLSSWLFGNADTATTGSSSGGALTLLDVLNADDNSTNTIDQILAQGRYGASSTVSMSAAAQKAAASSSASGTTWSDKAGKALTAASSGGIDIKSAFDSMFKGVSSDKATAIKDQVETLLEEMQNGKISSALSKGKGRTTSRKAAASGDTSSVVTLTSSQNGLSSLLRIESTTSASGKTTLHLTYTGSGSSLGAVDLTVSRQASTTSGKSDTLTADVVQKKILPRGRLSAPVSTDHYEGAL